MYALPHLDELPRLVVHATCRCEAILTLMAVFSKCMQTAADTSLLFVRDMSTDDQEGIQLLVLKVIVARGRYRGQRSASKAAYEVLIGNQLTHREETSALEK